MSALPVRDVCAHTGLSRSLELPAAGRCQAPSRSEQGICGWQLLDLIFLHPPTGGSISQQTKAAPRGWPGSPRALGSLGSRLLPAAGPDQPKWLSHDARSRRRMQTPWVSAECLYCRVPFPSLARLVVAFFHTNNFCEAPLPLLTRGHTVLTRSDLSVVL